jgi:hypothetical protein
VSGVSRNRGSFVKCVAIQERLGIPDVEAAPPANIVNEDVRGVYLKQIPFTINNID